MNDDTSLTKNIIEKKLIAFALSVFLTFILVVNDKLDDNVYESVYITSIVAFIAGEAYTNKKNGA